MNEQLTKDVYNFINFCLERYVFNAVKVDDIDLVAKTFEETVQDFNYHYTISEEGVRDNIIRSGGGLPVFLFRLGKQMDLMSYPDHIKYQIHFLMKTLCSCEIYWSTEIDVGFLVDHGQGTVIGSRCNIGKGFWIHQGCTIGHNNLSLQTFPGPQIGDNVTVAVGSQILGNITVGNNTMVAANSMVIHSVKGDEVVAGVPAKHLKQLNK